MSYKPKDFTVEAIGYYDGLYGRSSNPCCVLEKDRWQYAWAYGRGTLKRREG